MNMNIRATAVFVLMSAFVAGIAVWPVRAQSLADLARKEEDRRKAATQTPTNKTYTNKDLGAPLPPTVSSSGDTASTDATGDTKDAKDSKDAAKNGKDAAKDGKAAADPKDQAYWGGKIKSLREKL